jgi:proteic killer suppression protein
MKAVIDNKSLREIYTKGRSKKLRFPPGVAEKFVERVARIEAAINIDDLRYPPSMQFEKFQGHQNYFSIRLNQQYRLVFEVKFDDNSKKTGIILIKEIWDHSKKY